MTDHPLTLTGERTLPGIPHERYWFSRHEVAYRLAAGRCRGLDVLDAGCGEGYGTALLATTAASATGVELVAEVCAHARATYSGAAFIEADVCAVPLPADSVGAVVSLQVIEHLPDIGRYLGETARLLRPGGLFICGTPNRLTFTPGNGGPVNPFHEVEFSAAELTAVLDSRFAVNERLGVFHGPRIAAIEAERGGPFTQLLLAEPAERWPVWLVEVVASVTAADFHVAADDLDASLDLIAICTTPDEGS